MKCQFYEVSVLLPTFLAYVKTQFAGMIKHVRSNKGIEFGLQKFFTKNGIIHQLTCVETP